MSWCLNGHAKIVLFSYRPPMRITKLQGVTTIRRVRLVAAHFFSACAYEQTGPTDDGHSGISP